MAEEIKMSNRGSEGDSQTQVQDQCSFPTDPRTRSKYYQRILNARANESSSGSSAVTVPPPPPEPRPQSSNEHQQPPTCTSAVTSRQNLNSLNGQLPPINSSSSTSNHPSPKSSFSSTGSGRTNEKEIDVKKISENSQKKSADQLQLRSVRSPSPPKCSSPSSNLQIRAYWISNHRLGMSTTRLHEGAMKALIRIKGLKLSNDRVEFDTAMYDRVSRTLQLFRPEIILEAPSNGRNYPYNKFEKSRDYGDNEKSARTSEIQQERVPVTAPRSAFSKSVSPPGGTILCEPYLEFYSFKEIDLSIEAIQLLKKKGQDLSIYSVNCGTGRFWYFSLDHYYKISSALSELTYPMKLDLQSKTEKTNQNQVEGDTGSNGAALKPAWSWGIPTSLPSPVNTVDSNLTNTNTNASTTATLPDSDFKTDIPGYEFEKYLCLPRTLKNLAGTKGMFYCQDQISISNFDVLQVSSYTSNQKIILRLIAVDKLGHSTQGEENGFLIQHVKCNGNDVTFPTKKATSGSIDLTEHFRRSVLGLVDVTAEFEDMNENQISQSIRYFVCIARKLNAEQMLQSLKLKPPIPIQKSRTMILDSLKKAEKDGILTDDLKHVSLRCPLGKARMTTPCKGIRCGHYACFDASNFLKLYEKTADWKCPICDLALEYEDLRIDSFYDVILKSIEKEKENYYIKVEPVGLFDLVVI